MIKEVIHEVFPGIFKIHIKGEVFLATLNLTRGRKVYNEQLFEIEGKEYRSWNPTRSKLGAAIIKGLKTIPIKPKTTVLYLGVASGTTCSHISDIVNETGHIWGVDFSERPIRDLIENVTRYRKNITPLLNDARQPRSYSIQVPMVDTIYADVAQPDQALIVIKNAKLFLKKSGSIILVIKSRSVDVSKNPNEIYASQIQILKDAGFSIKEVIDLDPYEKDHALVLAKFS
ncbi:fibrillarin-like rRNA/tRNA 2'-O-methyltransferase [Candidatus Bathyarchaeota archaeon]|nr:fibrillarin-like rRNA/tRNA 2'-O-methyltransferase [Candidatus Bathyarchaeota archaeon]